MIATDSTPLWFLRSLRGADTHRGSYDPVRGSVHADCGLRFVPLKLQGGAIALKGNPPDREQTCPACHRGSTVNWRWATPDNREASQVLFVFGAGGYPPGGFFAALLEAMNHADPQNLAKLALGFPGYASAMWAAANTDDGLAQLRELVRAEPCAGGGDQ